MTLTGFTAWLLALTQIQSEYRRIFVPASFLIVIVALFAIAMTMRRDSTGKLDYDNNLLLDTLEPAFKFSFLLAVIGFIAFMVAICYAVYAVFRL